MRKAQEEVSSSIGVANERCVALYMYSEAGNECCMLIACVWGIRMLVLRLTCLCNSFH